MKVRPPRQLRYRTHWALRVTLGLAFAVMGVTLMLQNLEAPTLARWVVGGLLLLASLAILTYVHELVIDEQARRVERVRGLLLRFGRRSWPFEDFRTIGIDAIGGSTLGGAQGLFYAKLNGSAVLRVPKPSGRQADAYQIAAEIAEVMKLPFEPRVSFD